jgi:hypothetical protein
VRGAARCSHPTSHIACFLELSIPLSDVMRMICFIILLVVVLRPALGFSIYVPRQGESVFVRPLTRLHLLGHRQLSSSCFKHSRDVKRATNCSFSTSLLSVIGKDIAVEKNTPLKPKRPPPYNAGKKLPEELKLKIQKTIHMVYHQKKILKASTLGMSVDEYDIFRLNVKRAQTRKYRQNMKIKQSLGVTFKREKKVPVGHIVRKHNATLPRENHNKERVMRHIIEKALQRLWLKLPLPNSLLRTQRRFLLCKAVAIQFPHTVQIFDREHDAYLKELISLAMKKKISTKVKKMWKDPLFRKKALRNRSTNARSLAVKAFRNHTKIQTQSKVPPHSKGKQNLLKDQSVNFESNSSINVTSNSNLTETDASSEFPLKHKLKFKDRSEASSTSLNLNSQTETMIHEVDAKATVEDTIHKKIETEPHVRAIGSTEKHALDIASCTTTPSKVFEEPILTRPAKRPILVQEGVSSIKVYKDGKLIGVYTREEFDLMGIESG